MKDWWKQLPLKFRLACWFAAACLTVVLGMVLVVYVLIEHRLYVELDKQLLVDWDLVVTHLETDAAGDIQWRSSSPATPDSPGYVGTSFDVWAGDQRLLDYVSIFRKPLLVPAPTLPETEQLHRTLDLSDGQQARIYERHCWIDKRDVVLRVYRNLEGLQHTLEEIVIAFFLGAPVAALLAALGGYFIAGRALHPIGAMAEQARQITSESLSQRLPIQNPHDELGQLAVVINETLERLETSFFSLRRFTADASHELRTPLTALRTVGEVSLRESGDFNSWREAVSSMLEEANRLHALIDVLLVLARTDANQSPIRLTKVDVAKAINEVREQLDILANDKQQSIFCGLEPGLAVQADETLLRQVIFNLLHNAIAHSPAHSEIRISASRHDTEVSIAVADNGSGIAPEHHDKIFERFYRVDKARSREAGGSGLGLAIVKLLAVRMGGRIDLESQPAHGSRFQITLKSN